MTEQEENKTRVRDRIGKLIREFYYMRRNVGGEFRAEELRTYVLSRDRTIAPASPDRILRDLRQSGELDYEVLNRRASLYRFTYAPFQTEMGF